MEFKKAFLFGAVAATVLSACGEKDYYDPNYAKEVENANRLSAYQAAFKSVYGPIAADQNWDFTQQSLTTRAVDPQFAGFWTEDYVLTTVFDEHEAINEVFAKLPEGKDHRQTATPFIFVVPDDNIVITPQFQGKNSWATVQLHMVVNNNGDIKDYIIWEKGNGMQIKKYENSQWTDVPSAAGTTMYGTQGYETEEAMNTPVYAVRSKQLIIPKGTLPVGATITLYTYNVRTVGSTEYYWYSTNVKDSKVGVTRIYGNSIGYVTAKNQADKVTYVACEGGDNMDLNDLIFKMEGITPVPLVEPYSYNEITAKRYMVEDLGATATSDIDFNDLVIDFVSSIERKFQIIDANTDHARIELIKNNKAHYELEVTIRALGGVQDMELYLVGGEMHDTPQASDWCVWSKSGKTIEQSMPMWPWKYNGLTALNYETMYNTGWSGDPFSYNPKSEVSSESWIGRSIHTSEYGDPGLWKPERNNILIKVYPTGSSVVDDKNDYSSANAKSPYYITFPKNGTVPCMVAFRPTKQWRLERDGISKEESEYWFRNTSSIYPGEYYTE